MQRKNIVIVIAQLKTIQKQFFPLNLNIIKNYCVMRTGELHIAETRAILKAERVQM